MSPRPLEGVNLLELAPARVAEWEEVGDRIVVHRPRPNGPWPARAVHWLLYLMAPRRIRLDECGSFAWRRLDGRCTVGDLAQHLRDRFGDAVEPAEQRLGRLIRVMRREGLVEYRICEP
jgi:hypothetical protein